MTTHHGLEQSNAKEIVYAVQPRVAVMNNGARRRAVLRRPGRSSSRRPGLEDLWQIHYSIAGRSEANSPEPFIANLEEQCQGQYLKLTATCDGSFSVGTAANKYSTRLLPR